MTYRRIDLTDEPEITHALFRLGKYIEKHGVRRDFDAAITDCYLGKDIRFSFPVNQCVMLREKLEGTDDFIEPGNVPKRIEIIEKLIFKEIWSYHEN